MVINHEKFHQAISISSKVINRFVFHLPSNKAKISHLWYTAYQRWLNTVPIDRILSVKNVRAWVSISYVIFPGLFLFSSPRTFGLFKSRDFLVPGPSGSLGPGTISPGTSDLLSQDFPGRPGTFISILLQFLEVRCYLLDFCNTFYFLLGHLSELDHIFQ